MGGYVKSNKVRSIKIKNDYIQNHDIADMNRDYYDTVDNNFWELLAKENHTRHTESKGFCKNGECIEARQLIIGMPQDSNITAKELCDTFKNKYGVECICAIHTKQDKQGNITNKHAHLIFADRKKLDEPEIVGEKRAVRTYYYDKNGKKCKKNEAVKTVPKGTIMSKGVTHYFSSKNEFFGTLDFVNEVKDLFLNKTLEIGWDNEEDIVNRKLGLNEKHIGYKNINSKHIKDNNQLKQMIKASCEVNYFYLEQDLKFKNFKDYTENILKSNNVVNLRTKSFKENNEKMLPYINKTIDKYYDEIFKTDVVDNTLMDLNNVNEEIREKASQPLDVITNDDITFIDRLSNTWKDLLANLKHLLHFQKFFINPEYHITLAKDEDNYIYKVNGEDNSNTEEDSEGIER